MNTAARIIAVILLLPLCSCSDSTGPGENVNVGGKFIVLAWNNLGMHCLNPTYDQAVILPPYNTLWAQVIQKGNPPEIVTAGITVEFAIELNTYSYGKRNYGKFWDNAVALFGPLLGFTSLPHDTGLTGIGLSGRMTAAADHFIAEGIPVTPVNDTGAWNPYQVAVITVRGGDGTVLAQTRATVPVSDEINCDKCHTGVAGVSTAAVLYRDAPGHGGVYCAACHGSPHAMYPSQLSADNYQPLQYQNFTGKVKTLGSCGVCHDNSRGAGKTEEFSEAHGGTSPEHKIGCHACHTVVPAATSNWPHAFEWKNSNQ